MAHGHHVILSLSLFVKDKSGYFLVVTAVAVMVLLSACAVERVTPGPASSLDILGPRPDLVTVGLDGSWKISDTSVLKTLSIERFEGIPGLRMRPMGHAYSMVRRLDAQLTVTPFLTWTWLTEENHSQRHPVHIIAGFNSGSGASEDPKYEWFDDDLPHHDRAIEFIWSDSALARGTFKGPQLKPARPPYYVVRGGREAFGVWWYEALDLQALYQRAWPKDDIFGVRVSFLGFRTETGAEDEAMTVSGLRLSR